MAAPQSELTTSIAVPAQLTSFVGREREAARVCALLRRHDVRLLTLTGPGGVGKTRLALAASATVAADFADGARFVPLAAVRDHRLVAAVLARAVGVPELSALPFADQVRAAARDTEALLLIDNFEHVLSAAPLLTELLAVCPRLTLLVTSRERLRVSGERDAPVLPLSYPDPEHLPPLPEVAAMPAVRLFTERAQAIDPDFTLTADTAAAVAAICHRLDGLPLALELAAARSPHLTPAALLVRLARRLPLLTGGPRDVPARLQTMRDAIRWSYDLLTTEEQVLFRRLAVFAGGFTLDAAEAIAVGGSEPCSGPCHPAPAPSVLDGIASLVDKSLVRRINPQDVGSGERSGDSLPRFEMLETIREFGLEQLASAGEEEAIRAAHAAFCLEMVASATAPDAEETAGFDVLERELANIRAALAWPGTVGERGVALPLSARLGRFWLRRGHQLEGRDWLQRALAGAPEDDPAMRSAALSALGDLDRDLGNRTEATRSFERALDLARQAGDRAAEATALDGLAALADDVTDIPTSKALCEASAAIWRELGNRRGLARALHTLGWAEAGQSNLEAASALFDESLIHARACGDHRGIAHTLNSLGNLRVLQGALADAHVFLEDSLTAARAASDLPEIAEALADLGWLALEMNDTAPARAYLAECLELLRGNERGRTAVIALEECALLADAEDQHDLAGRFVAATAALRAEMGIPVERDPRLIVTTPTSARQRLRKIIAATAGRKAWSMDEAIREARALVATSPASSAADERAGPCGLSPRELDVLRLLVRGQSDRAIADTLFISRRTASKHVSSILAKLGVRSRTEAAARAVRDGLA
ncbi:MAG: ATP-binding protein [Thermomicrobiales bacterium]